MDPHSLRWCEKCNKMVYVYNSANSELPVCYECHNPVLVQLSEDDFLPPHIALRYAPDDNENAPVRWSAVLDRIEGKTEVEIKNAETCPICYVDFILGELVEQLPCGHRFHDECITNWFHSHNSCPMCRFDVPEEARIRKGCGGSDSGSGAGGSGSGSGSAGVA